MIARLAADLKLAAKLKRAGIVYPLRTIQAARAAHLPLPILCAVLEQESGGGRNVFGHDPVHPPQVQGGRVTRWNYARYKRLRDAGYGTQGVGPMQLTWYSFQDRADALGGCWKPRHNLAVGAGLLADSLRRDGLRLALVHYNGGERYAREVMARIPKWELLTR